MDSLSQNQISQEMSQFGAQVNLQVTGHEPLCENNPQLRFTVTRNFGMNQNFADVNPEQDFQPFNDEKNSHLQTKIS